MENYKKERSSKQHMKIDVGQNVPQDDVFTLANPMTYGDATTPTSPPTQPAQAVTRPGGHTVSNPTTPTTSHSTGFSRTFERLSLKTKSKNQSFFKFFGRGHEKATSTIGNGGCVADRNGGLADRNGGVADRNGMGPVAKRASMQDEDFGGDGSSGSDHDDAFSPQSSGSSGEMLRANRQCSEPPKSPPPGNVEVFAALPRQPNRHHSGGHYSRDSGFSSERESVSHVRITPQTSLNTEDDRGSPSGEVEYQPAGMEALEILHNQLQLLVKRDSDEDTDSVDIYEQIINSLSRQLEEQCTAMDLLKQTETNLRLSLRLAEQRALEAETEKAVLQERCVHAEQRCAKLSAKYKALKGRRQDNRGTPPNSKTSSIANAYPSSRNSIPQYPPNHYHQTGTANGTSSQAQGRTPPQRVQSQTIFDRRQRPIEQSTIPSIRPSTAQGFHNDKAGNPMSSLSHTETCV